MHISAARNEAVPVDHDRVVHSIPLHEGWLDLLMLRLRLNERDEERQVIRHPCGVAVLAYDPVRRVAMVIQQTRTAALLLKLPALMEVVAGVVDDEDLVANARREAFEEAGLELHDLTHVGCVIMNPSTSTETVDLFLAEYSPADRVGDGGGLEEENERIVVREAGLNELWTELATANPADAKTVLLFQALRLRRPDLFKGAT